MRRFFEIFPAATAWTTLLGLVFLSWKLPVWVVLFIVLYDLFWLLKTVYLFFYLNQSFVKLRRYTKTDWLEKLKNEKSGEWERIRHLVMFPMYKEPHEVVRQTFESFSKTKYPLEKMIVVLALEDRAGSDAKALAERIREEFGARFGHFLITTHPSDLPGEIQGKGSNETWAARRVKEEIIDPNNIPYEDIIVSVFDIDTRPGEEYFGILSYKFLTVESPHRSSFQPIPLFTNNVHHVSAFARLIGFTSTFWQLMQQGRPEQLVTFSSHSMPFAALPEIGYWDTDVTSEDSRIFFQCMLHYKGDWKVEPLYYPIYMDAVTGSGFWNALGNLYKQQRRWAWGIENFPYVMEAFWKRKDIPGRVKRFWTWRIFDGFYSWATSSFIIFLFGWLPNLLGDEAFRTSVFSYNLPRITGTLVNVASIGIVTSAVLSVLLLPPKMEGFKKRHAALYFLQWVLTPLTFIVFGSIPALEAQTRLMLGGKFRLGFWVTPKDIK